MTNVNPSAEYAAALCSDRKALAYLLGYPAAHSLPEHGEFVTLRPWGLRFQLLSRAAAYQRGTRRRLYVCCPVCGVWRAVGCFRAHYAHKHVDCRLPKGYLDARIGPDRSITAPEQYQ